MPDRRTSWVALALLCALVLLPLGDLANVHVPEVPDRGDRPGTWWIFYPPHRVGADLMATLPHLKDNPEWYPQYRTMAMGEAARRIAEGPVDSLIVPSELELLVAEDPALVEQEPLYRDFITRMSAGNERYIDYDPALDAHTLDALLDENASVTYPRSVVGIEAAEETRFVLHTDPERELIYVVPLSLSPLEVDDAS